jgi:hypothetical protein
VGLRYTAMTAQSQSCDQPEKPLKNEPRWKRWGLRVAASAEAENASAYRLESIIVSFFCGSGRIRDRCA